MEAFSPALTKHRKEREDPRVTFSRSEILLECLARFLTERELPKVKKLATDVDAPPYNSPRMERPEPDLTNCLKLRLDPIVAKPRAETERPAEPLPRSESEEPTWDLWITERVQQEPRPSPIVEKFEPMRTLARRLRAEPRVTADNIEQLEDRSRLFRDLTDKVLDKTACESRDILLPASTWPRTEQLDPHLANRLSDKAEPRCVEQSKLNLSHPIPDPLKDKDEAKLTY